MRSVRRFTYGSLAAIALAVIVFAFSYRTFLTAAGSYLVQSDSPEKSDAILVLAGDYRGRRILRAAELVRDGFAPMALVSGPTEMYGLNEGELAIQYAVRNGVSANYFESVPIKANSTLEEARAFAPILRERGIRRLLLVTSNFHSHRAARIFRRVMGSDILIRSIAASDPYFEPGSWWQNREGQKTVFYEYSKIVADWLGM